MIDQINNIEAQLKNELKKTRSAFENEREFRMRLETNVKYLEEQVKDKIKLFEF